MDNFNSIILEGNLVRNPEARETPKGTVVCLFSIAVNKKYKKFAEKELCKNFEKRVDKGRVHPTVPGSGAKTQ